MQMTQEDLNHISNLLKLEMDKQTRVIRDEMYEMRKEIKEVQDQLTSINDRLSRSIDGY